MGGGSLPAVRIDLNWTALNKYGSAGRCPPNALRHQRELSQGATERWNQDLGDPVPTTTRRMK
ncbi:MAG: hypothetical protein U0361_09390 [Nitrospiraceae bacterium]